MAYDNITSYSTDSTHITPDTDTNLMKHFYHKLGEDWFTYPMLYKSVVEKVADSAHFVEVGSWKGRSAAYMAVEIYNSKKSIKFDCVDTWEGSIEHREDDCIINKTLYLTFLKNTERVSNIIRPIRTTSLTASTLYKDNSLDFVFIDASHEYQDVIDDINAWLPKVKIGGILAGHDFYRESVITATFDALSGHNLVPAADPNGEGCWIVEKSRRDAEIAADSDVNKKGLTEIVMEDDKIDKRVVQEFLKNIDLWKEFNEFLTNKQNLEKV